MPIPEPPIPTPPRKICLWPGCTRPPTRRGYCQRDYERIARALAPELPSAATDERLAGVAQAWIAERPKGARGGPRPRKVEPQADPRIGELEAARSAWETTAREAARGREQERLRAEAAEARIGELDGLLAQERARGEPSSELRRLNELGQRLSDEIWRAARIQGGVIETVPRLLAGLTQIGQALGGVPEGEGLEAVLAATLKRAEERILYREIVSYLRDAVVGDLALRDASPLDDLTREEGEALVEALCTALSEARRASADQVTAALQRERDQERSRADAALYHVADLRGALAEILDRDLDGQEDLDLIEAATSEVQRLREGWRWAAEDARQAAQALDVARRQVAAPETPESLERRYQALQAARRLRDLLEGRTEPRVQLPEGMFTLQEIWLWDLLEPMLPGEIERLEREAGVSRG